MIRTLVAGLLLALAMSTLEASADPIVPPGLTGEYYAPAKPGAAPQVLVLGGSEGGLDGSRPIAQRLAESGYGALALAYFHAPGVPPTLQSVPLEYFTRAIDWLAARPEAAGRRVAVLGGSKGGEAALLIASGDRRICAVVAGAPSSVAWAGFNPADFISDPGPSWTRGGKPVPYAPYDRTAPFKGLLDFYTRSLAQAPPEAAIPVEKIAGPVLLISGRQDQLWPSSAMSDAVMARLDAAKFKPVHQHLAYDDAGHAAFGLPLAPDSPNLARLGQLGGSAAGNQAARQDAWPKALAFLDDAFRTGCR